jgi:hypothetical protein
LETRGGANRGRVVDNGEGFYTLWSRRHSRHELYLLPEAAQLRITGHAPTISIGLASPKAEYRAGPAGST